MTKYFGLFRDIRDSGINNLVECSIYDAPMNQVYHLNTASNEEINFYVDELLNAGDSVLELCCGNGRLTLPLLKRGFLLDGIDISQDMLALLDREKVKLPKQLQRNLRIFAGDIFSFQPDKTYDAVILPATTISILLDFAEFPKLLNKLYSWLNRDGKFIFDYCAEYPAMPSQASYGNFQVDGLDYNLFYQDFVQSETGRAISNFYLYRLNGNNQLEHYIATANKKILTREDLISLLNNHGFALGNSLSRRESGYCCEMLSFGKNTL